jgi:hypothetical protein
MDLKPGSGAQLTTKLEEEIIPLLRKQKGFQDGITFVSPARNEAFGVSLWDNKQHADDYNRGAYLEVSKMVADLVEGSPRVETYEVANSTFHKIAAEKAA